MGPESTLPASRIEILEELQRLCRCAGILRRPPLFERVFVAKERVIHSSHRNLPHRRALATHIILQPASDIVYPALRKCVVDDQQWSTVLPPELESVGRRKVISVGEIPL